MVPMTHRKIICIALVLIFGLTLSASGALGRVACDKALCRHHTIKGPENKKTDLNFVSMGCCGESQKDPCKLERSTPHMILDYALSGARVHKDGLSDVITIGSNVNSENLLFGIFDPHLKDGTHIPSTPIYIRNVNLIC
jgi:hypothetical protein